MKYVEPHEISREQAESAFESADPSAICHALVNLTFFEDDWKWMSDTCMRYVEGSDKNIALTAIICLGHVARIHHRIDDRVLARLNELKSDPVLGGTAEDALSDVEIFVDGRPA